jgi:hypothetical protein
MAYSITYIHEVVSKTFRTESITKYTLTTINTRWEATQRVMAANLTRLTHRIVIQLYLLAESYTICTSRSRRPILKLLDTPSYIALRSLTLREDTWSYLREQRWRECLELRGSQFTTLRFTGVSTVITWKTMESLKGRHHFGDVGLVHIIILKRILKKQYLRIWTGLNLFRIASGIVLF